MQNIREGIEGHSVNWFSEVFDLAFRDLDHARAANVWKEQLDQKPTKPRTRAGTKSASKSSEEEDQSDED